MLLDAYPISGDFRVGAGQVPALNWQLFSSDERALAITPKLTFVGEQVPPRRGGARLLRPLGLPGRSYRRDPGVRPGYARSGGCHRPCRFTIEGQPFMAMESSWDHAWGFTEALSLARSRAPISSRLDHYWDALSQRPWRAQPGGVVGKQGVSWQAGPRRLIELLRDPDREPGWPGDEENAAGHHPRHRRAPGRLRCIKRPRIVQTSDLQMSRGIARDLLTTGQD